MVSETSLAGADIPAKVAKPVVAPVPWVDLSEDFAACTDSWQHLEASSGRYPKKSQMHSKSNAQATICKGR